MSLLEQLRGGLVVSVQAWPGSAIDDPGVIAAMARAAQDNGAAAVRVQGVENLTAVRSRVDIPVIGLIKRKYDGFEPYITPTVDEVERILACGAEIVAFDATGRERPGGVSIEAMLDAVHRGRGLAMADCATPADALCAHAEGAEIVATTLCGYTVETQGHPLPALDVVREMRELTAFVICEGGVHHPAEARTAFAAGADAVVVGTAITNVDWLVREFAEAAPKKKNR